MDLVIRNLDKNISIIRPVISHERNVESIIAKVKMVIFDSPEKNIVLDLRKINFLDCIKIGTIIGTYHFLDFSGKKIYILVQDIEVKKSIKNLSFNNIEIYCAADKHMLEGIA